MTWSVARPALPTRMVWVRQFVRCPVVVQDSVIACCLVVQDSVVAFWLFVPDVSMQPMRTTDCACYWTFDHHGWHSSSLARKATVRRSGSGSGTQGLPYPSLRGCSRPLATAREPLVNVALQPTNSAG